MTMIKARPWNGKGLKGNWQLTYKIDGVRALWTSKEGWLSRANKPLYNIPPPVAAYPARIRDCEVFLGNFRDTIRAVRTKTLKADTPKVLVRHLFSLDPLDTRLDAGNIWSPTETTIRETLQSANRLGYEGLVLRQGDKWIKVKPEETHDVLVTGAVEGKGKHAGRLGCLVTAKGEVGTGFTDKERDDIWRKHMAELDECKEDLSLMGATIEVSCMHFTPDGKFRHPRFVRMRPDKIATE